MNKIRILVVAISILTVSCSFSAYKPHDSIKSIPLNIEPWRIINRTPPAPVTLQGGTLNVCEFGSGPKSFNPVFVEEASSINVINQTFSALLDYNFKTEQIVDGLAYQWKSNEKKTIWTVHLRKNLRWSDGAPLNADDVVFTFQLISNSRLDNPLKDHVVIDGKAIKCIKLSDTIVRFFLPIPLSQFLFTLSSVPILPKHSLLSSFKNGTFASSYSIGIAPEKVICSGAFRIRIFSPQQRLVLERNPYYYAKDINGQRLPYLDRIVVSYVPNMNTAFLKFISGEVDALSGFPGRLYRDIKSEEKNGNYHVIDLGVLPAQDVLIFNENPNPTKLDPIKYKWFSNPLFRKALALLIDRNTIIRLAYFGLGMPAVQDFHPSSPFYDQSIKPYIYSPKEARRLLQQAKFFWKSGNLYDSEGNLVQFNLMTDSGNIEHRIAANILKEDLHQVGIHMDFQTIDLNQMTYAVAENFQWESVLIFYNTYPLSIEPSTFQSAWLSSGYDHAWYPRQKHPATAWEADIDKLVRKGSITFEFQKRKEIYDKIQEIVFKEQLPVIPTILPKGLYAFRNTMKNVDPTPMGRFWDLSYDDMLMTQVYMNNNADSKI